MQHCISRKPVQDKNLMLPFLKKYPKWIKGYRNILHVVSKMCLHFIQRNYSWTRIISLAKILWGFNVLKLDDISFLFPCNLSLSLLWLLFRSVTGELVWLCSPVQDWRNWLALQGQLAVCRMRSTQNKPCGHYRPTEPAQTQPP